MIQYIMTFKLILNKTATFLLVSAGVLIFQFLFGANNVIVGVGVIVQALFLLGTNITNHPFKNTFGILVLNFALGLCACVVPLNPWFGIILNFAMVFITVYLLTNDLTTPIYFPFMLTYIFMLMTAPVGFSELPLRLGALACGTLLIMVLQLLFNRNKSAKVSDTVFANVAQNLVEQINEVLTNDDSSKVNDSVSSDIRKMSQAMNERKKNNFFLSPTTLYKLNIGFCLERIGLIVSEIGEIKERPKMYDQCLQDMVEILQVFQEIDSANINSFHFKEIGVAFISRYNNANHDYVEIYELIQVVDILRKRVYKLSRLRGLGVKSRSFDGDIPKEFGVFYNLKKNLASGSIRFSFALRAAIAVSMTSFCTDIFHLEFGRWMVFTAFIIIQPYAEDAKTKFKKRIIGTLFGLAIFTILFMLISDPTIRALIMLLAGYISTYLKAYDKQMICITVSALGAAAMNETGPMLFEVDRIVYIIIGGLLAMLINRFVLRFTLMDTTKYLRQIYVNMLKKLSKMLLLDEFNSLLQHTCANLLLTINLVEDKLFLNNTILQMTQVDKFMENQRILINDFIFVAFGRPYWSKNDEQFNDIFRDIVEILDLVFSQAPESQWSPLSEKLETDLQIKINLSTTNHEKVYLNAISDILDEIKVFPTLAF